MNFLFLKEWWKYFLLIFAVLIGAFSLLYTNNLVHELSEEEKRKIELWASANKLVNEVDDDSEALNFLSEVIRKNETVPVILVDEEHNIIDSRNLDEDRSDDEEYLRSQLDIMESQHEPIMIEHSETRNYIYYKESNLVRQLRIFPYVQLLIISIFVGIAYLAFNASRKYEQNRVWVGLAKETAHQLGTPLSSLMAWVTYLESKDDKSLDDTVVQELKKDVERLQLVTDRFSKIGSSPALRKVDIYQLVQDSVQYLSNRLSKNVTVNVEKEGDEECYAFVSPPLFGWVIENLTKNAMDAMPGGGELTFRISPQKNNIFIDVIDTGKGIPSTYHEKIFEPGYTTRKRGWGLGLSLARRIIQYYHKGKLFVKESEPDKGTTLRIKLPL